MNPPSPPRPVRTLGVAEVIVGILILAVFIAMLFPCLGGCGPREASLRAKAKSDTLNIVHAVEVYVTEYSDLPSPDGKTHGAGTPGDVAVGDPAAGMHLDNASLFNILRDIDRPPNGNHIQNPKRQIYFGANQVSNPQRPKEGFLETASSGGAQGAFYDPWGSQYNIVLDSNADGLLDVKEFYSDFGGAAAPHVSVGAFSLGQGRKLGKGGDRRYQNGAEISDDLLSWAGR